MTFLRAMLLNYNSHHALTACDRSLRRRSAPGLGETGRGPAPAPLRQGVAPPRGAEPWRPSSAVLLNGAGGLTGRGAHHTPSAPRSVHRGCRAARRECDAQTPTNVAAPTFWGRGRAAPFPRSDAPDKSCSFLITRQPTF